MKKLKWFQELCGLFARPSAVIIGLVIAINLLRSVRYGLDMNLWWVDVRVLPDFVRPVLLSAAAMLFLVFGLIGWRSKLLIPCRIVVGGLILAAAFNAVVYWSLLAGGRLASGPAVPFSMLVVIALSLLEVGLFADVADTSTGKLTWRLRVCIGLVLCGLIVVGTFAQMYCFGWCDYRRKADAIVVFGAGVYPDGRMTLALADRMKRAVELYHQGLAPRMIVSGGPGMGDVHETRAMKRYAAEHGVPRAAILVDADGLSTRHTADNSLRMLEDIGGGRILAVSQFYHLPRIKLTFQQAGVEVFTVPACRTRPLARLGWYMTRESAVLWAYFLLE